MKLYLMSLGAGVLVGIIYALIDVRSPAPPVIALIGLFGMLLGEQIPPLVKGYLQQKPAGHSLAASPGAPAHVRTFAPRPRHGRDPTRAVGAQRHLGTPLATRRRSTASWLPQPPPT